MEAVAVNNKVIGRREFGPLRQWREVLVKNWCLKRSRVIYALASRCLPGDFRINVAMRCREDIGADWGHAWVSRNGQPFWEHNKAIANKAKTEIADTGKYKYWIFN